MQPNSLHYETPPRLLQPLGLPAWRDLLYTWPGCLIGLAAGCGASALYFTGEGWPWLPLGLLVGKAIIGLLAMVSDRYRWLGLGVLLSIPAGVMIFVRALGWVNWCC